MLFIFVGSAALLDSAPVGRRAVLTQPRAASVTCAQPSEPLSRRAVVASAAAALPAFFAQSAVAEQTLVTRQQAYSRYVPRIERGRDYWSTAVKKAVASSDWTTLNKAIEKKGSIDRIFGPMQLWASSFSGKSISEKTIAMNAAVDELRESVSSLTLNSQLTQTGGYLRKDPQRTDAPHQHQCVDLTRALTLSRSVSSPLPPWAPRRAEASSASAEPRRSRWALALSPSLTLTPTLTPTLNPYPDPDPTPDPGPTPNQEGKRQQLALAAYQKGVKAINKFIAIGNDGMGLQVRAHPVVRLGAKAAWGLQVLVRVKV
jgi:hypothetical protein